MFASVCVLNSLALHVLLQLHSSLPPRQFCHTHFSALFRHLCRWSVRRFAVIALLPLRYCRRLCSPRQMYKRTVASLLCYASVYATRKTTTKTLTICVQLTRLSHCVRLAIILACFVAVVVVLVAVVCVCNVFTLPCHTMLHMQQCCLLAATALCSAAAAGYNSFVCFFQIVFVVVVV